MDKGTKFDYYNEIIKKLNFWASKVTRLTHLVPKKIQTDAITQLRVLNQQPKNKWPNRNEIHSGLNWIPEKIIEMLNTLEKHEETKPGHQDILNDRVFLKDRCGWCDREYINYDNSHPKLDAKDGKPMIASWEHLKADLLKQSHAEIPEGFTLEQAEIPDDKTIKKMYKKIVKEFEKNWTGYRQNEKQRWIE